MEPWGGGQKDTGWEGLEKRSPCMQPWGGYYAYGVQTFQSSCLRVTHALACNPHPLLYKLNKPTGSPE